MVFDFDCLDNRESARAVLEQCLKEVTSRALCFLPGPLSMTELPVLDRYKPFNNSSPSDLAIAVAEGKLPRLREIWGWLGDPTLRYLSTLSSMATSADSPTLCVSKLGQSSKCLHDAFESDAAWWEIKGKTRRSTRHLTTSSRSCMSTTASSQTRNGRGSRPFCASQSATDCKRWSCILKFLNGTPT